MNKKTKQQIVKLCERIGWPSKFPFNEQHFDEPFAEAYLEKYFVGKLAEKGCDITRGKPDDFCDEIWTTIDISCCNETEPEESEIRNQDHLSALLDAAEAVLLK